LIPLVSASTQQISYYMHMAVHSDLNAGQRLAAKKYEESLYRLVSRRDDLHELRQSLPLSVFGFSSPTTQQQSSLFRQSLDFYNDVYVTISDLASLLGRMKDFWPDVPVRSNDRFLKWMASAENIPNGDQIVPILAEARDFRTLLNHSSQNAAYDWGTQSDRQERTTRIVLFGAPSSKGTVPAGSTLGTGEAAGWTFAAPDERAVTDALFAPVMVMGLIAGMHPIDDALSTCTLEAEGFGSAGWVATQSIIERDLSADYS
jgi:hypothetical protein